MELDTSPVFTCFVTWHPGSTDGARIADGLRSHFDMDDFRRVAGDAGLRVLFRSTPEPGMPRPRPIPWNSADSVAVVALVDRALAEDPEFSDYVRTAFADARTRESRALVIPVTLDADALRMRFEEQALRWDQWEGDERAREQRLVRDLTYEFSRMLRHRLDQVRTGGHGDTSLYRRKVEVFLSHSKNDNYGVRVAELVREWLHDNSQLSSFFDIHDIPPGRRFSSVILEAISGGVLLVVQTDTYSSREWCRREVLAAKLAGVPMVVVDALAVGEPRAFPYLGNAPVVRMNPSRPDQIGRIIGCLLDEILKELLWQRRVERFGATSSPVLFTARPPELLVLAGLPESTAANGSVIVYPDPPLSEEERRLFEAVRGDVRLRTVTQWSAEIEP